MKKKVMIAMSGGVDSSVAAQIIKKQGYDAIGATLLLYDAEGKGFDSSVNDAKKVSERMDIPYYTFNMQEEFKKEVIERFIESYENCETPNPCVFCNKHIKFGHFMNKMEELDCDYLATGHYAQIVFENDRFMLKKGLDHTKDQSYVLYPLTQKQLSHTLFPLGSMSKAEAREIALENEFINANKKDSQDICFVPDGKYAEFIEKYCKKTYPCGNFVDLEGNVLGEHKGLIRYTIGQRKGLGLALPKPMYVCNVSSKDNTVILGDNADLFSKSLDAKNINLIAYDTLSSPIRVKAKIRYSQSEQNATVWQTGNDTIHIEFDEPQRAITKGQSVVLYDDDYVIGGGIIK